MASTGRTRVRGGGFAPVQTMPVGRVVDVRSTDGMRLHTEVFGPPDGYPVVLAASRAPSGCGPTRSPTWPSTIG